MKKNLAVLGLGLLVLTACVPKAEGEGTDTKAQSEVQSSSALSQEETQEKQKEDTAEKKSFILGSEQFAKALDPVNEWDGWYTLRYGIGETLFRLDDKLQAVPWLAESFENIDAGTWKITLRQEIFFSDGTLLTADMVVKNLEKLAQSNPRAEFLKEAEFSISGREIMIKTKEPRASLIHDLTDPYSAMINLEKTADFANAPIGTGPYVVDKFVSEESIQLLPNTYYWNGKPKLDEVMVKKILDKETGALALQNGELDAFVELNPQSYLSFSADPAFKAESIATSRVYSAYYNTDILPDQKLREAIHLAIDKESMAKYLLHSTMQATESPFLQATHFGEDKLTVKKYDLEAAKAKLAEAGYADSDGDGILDQDGKNVEFDIVYYPRLSNELIATQLQSELTNLGMKVGVVKKDNTEYLKNGEYGIGFLTMVTTPTGDPQSYLDSTMSKDGVTNYNHFENAEAQQLLQEFNSATDPAKRAELAVHLSQILYDEHSIEYIGFNNLNVVTSAKVTGYAAHPSDYYQITVDIDKVE